MGSWHDFFMAEVGAGAALAGLLFVALSINIVRIIKIAWLPPRAAQSLIAFMTVVLLGSIALVPATSPRLLGIGFAFVVATAFAISLRLSVAQLAAPAEYRHHMVINVVTNAIFYGVSAAGAICAIAGLGRGISLIAFAAVYALCYGMFNAWVLLVEILR